MSQPTRFRDDASDPRARALLAVAPRPRPMSTAERSRSATRVDRLVALPVAAGVALWWKGVAAATAALVSVGVAVTTLSSPSSSPPAAPAAAPSSAPARAQATVSPARSVAPAPEPPPAPEATAAPSSSAPSVARVMPSSPRVSSNEVAPAPSAVPEPLPSAPPPVVEPADSLAREAQLLEAARGMLARNPSGALAKLDEHAATFPRGKLGLEREFLAVDALRRAGRTGEARARGEALLSRSRGSLYEARVQKMLDGLP